MKMLKCGQTPIDLTAISDQAINIAQQLIDISLDYKNRCLFILDPFLNSINEAFMQYYQFRVRLFQIPIYHQAVLPKRYPWLIELDLSDKYEHAVLTYMVDKALKQLTPQSIAAGQGQQYCAWLFSAERTKSIVHQLSNMTLQRNNKILLRYYDPAVFFQLLHLLNPAQKSRLFGIIEMWAVLNRQGELNIHQNEGQIHSNYNGELLITHEQYQQLQCIGINNMLIQAEKLTDPQKNTDEIENLQTIMPCLLRLKTKKIEDNDFHLEWAKLALKFGKDFDIASHIDEIIKDLSTVSEYIPILKKLHAISPQDWQTLALKNKEENV
ncbi:DUF4123 domain-containing protein [Gilliamella sp. B2969]|uniref:DUF4123 domain-containing protein n=1 Tax=Gilliamella sp. B2969 TaxID=2818021 RepID=UPI00226A168C|nr:DUF4123 domain-containing protein [Gilliamella sp. B2969]MCX8728809.1 DUF4123 domain-containing protein [Gilliamella sp. B2969]